MSKQQEVSPSSFGYQQELQRVLTFKDLVVYGMIFMVPIAPLIGLAIIAYVWSGFDSMTFYVGFGWMALGIIVGAVKSKGYKEIPDGLKNRTM